MATDRVRALLDDIGKVSGRRLEQLRAGSAAPAAADNPLGLRFATGARVIDLVTGDRGLVQMGHRDGSTNAEIFRVQLTNASVQWRSREQLEPDPTPATPAGK